MRTKNELGYDWLFNEDGKVIEGKECVYIPAYDCWDAFDEKTLCKLNGYWPYSTDGDYDPKLEEVDYYHHIEVSYGERGYSEQVSLSKLVPLTVETAEKEVLYDGHVRKVYGTFTNTYDDDYVVLVVDDKHVIAESYECEDEWCSPYDLGEEELKTLFSEIRRGSIYLSDYRNSVGVTWDEASDYCDDYYRWLEEKYGDKCDDHDNLESWLEFAIY